MQVKLFGWIVLIMMFLFVQLMKIFLITNMTMIKTLQDENYE